MNDKLAKTEDNASLMTFIGQAIDRLGGEGAKDAAEAIKTLVQLKREEDAIRARREFIVALNEFQKRCPPIPKDRSTKDTGRGGNQWQIKYAPLDTIERIVRPLLVPLGFTWRWDTVPVPPNGVTVTCHLSHVGGHSESSSITLDSDQGGSMNKTQRGGATRTYGERYSFEQVLGLVTTDDTDGIAHAPEELEPIAEDQQATIEHLLGLSSRPAESRSKFLKVFGIASVAGLHRSDYARAVDALRRAAVK